MRPNQLRPRRSPSKKDKTTEVDPQKVEQRNIKNLSKVLGKQIEKALKKQLEETLQSTLTELLTSENQTSTSEQPLLTVSKLEKILHPQTNEKIVQMAKDQIQQIIIDVIKSSLNSQEQN